MVIVVAIPSAYFLLTSSEKKPDENDNNNWLTSTGSCIGVTLMKNISKSQAIRQTAYGWAIDLYFDIRADYRNISIYVIVTLEDGRKNSSHQYIHNESGMILIQDVYIVTVYIYDSVKPEYVYVAFTRCD